MDDSKWNNKLTFSFLFASWFKYDAIRLVVRKGCDWWKAIVSVEVACEMDERCESEWTVDTGYFHYQLILFHVEANQVRSTPRLRRWMLQ